MSIHNIARLQAEALGNYRIDKKAGLANVNLNKKYVTKTYLLTGLGYYPIYTHRYQLPKTDSRYLSYKEGGYERVVTETTKKDYSISESSSKKELKAAWNARYNPIKSVVTPSKPYNNEITLQQPSMYLGLGLLLVGYFYSLMI